MWIISKSSTIAVSFLIAHHKCDGGPEYKLWEQAISCMKDGDGNVAGDTYAPPLRRIQLYDELTFCPNYTCLHAGTYQHVGIATFMSLRLAAAVAVTQTMEGARVLCT